MNAYLGEPDNVSPLLFLVGQGFDLGEAQPG